MCNLASIDCYFSNYVSCPGVDNVRQILEDGLNKSLIEVVTF